MIQNHQQYQLTQERLQGFKKTLALLNSTDNELRKKDPTKWQINLDVLESFIEDFSEQIIDYEMLVNHDESQPITFSLNSLNELPSVLIKTRIASKITQAELAAKIGKEAKEIKRLEKNDYDSLTLTELLQISEALGIKINFSAVASAS